MEHGIIIGSQNTGDSEITKTLLLKSDSFRDRKDFMSTHLLACYTKKGRNAVAPQTSAKDHWAIQPSYLPTGG